MLFSMILDRPPLQWDELPRALMTWVQNVGGLAALAGLIVVLASRRQRDKNRLYASPAAMAAFGVSWLGYGAFVLLVTANAIGEGSLYEWLPTSRPATPPGQLPLPAPPASPGDWLLAAAGALSLAAVLAPVLAALVTRLRFGRIWAIARLSFKEAIRSKAVIIFGAMIPVFLFAAWFIPYKPEHQVQNYVLLLHVCMTILFLMTASLLGAFGIPTDVKTQTIHTIVTKPVEKFEVVLGRYLGYAVLLTVGLLVVTGASMLYLVRGVTEEARRESFTAREPIYGFLTYHGTKGENVGRMHDVRGYITGQSPNQPVQQRQYAVWTFDSLPASVGADGQPVRFEFGFDIFRLTKGVENQGVLTTFTFADGRMSLLELERAKERRKRDFDQMHATAVRQAAGDPAALPKAIDEIEAKLLQEHRLYVQAGVNVTDYHTQQLNVPAALFQQLHQLETAEVRKGPGESRPPMFQVVVSVDYDALGKNQQMLGVARTDLYLLAAEHSFFVNFVKGIVGLWSLTMLVLGMAVACSSYLSGVISWLCTIFFVIAGIFILDIQELAENRSAGGGPLVSAFRLASKLPIAGELEESPTTTIITQVDDFYRWCLRFFLNLVPDVTRYDLHQYVASGFDISWSQVLLLDNLLPLLGYLFPWAILAFYLMKYREIANPM